MERQLLLFSAGRLNSSKPCSAARENSKARLHFLSRRPNDARWPGLRVGYVLTPYGPSSTQAVRFRSRSVRPFEPAPNRVNHYRCVRSSAGRRFGGDPPIRIRSYGRRGMWPYWHVALLENSLSPHGSMVSCPCGRRPRAHWNVESDRHDGYR